MDPANDPFVAHCMELLGGVGRVRARRMFGGCGLYIDELFVALVTNDCLYLKVDAQTRARFEARGCTPFVYRSAGRDVALSYYTVPDEAMESPLQMQDWARQALGAAVRSRTRPPPKRRSAVLTRPRAP